MKENWSSERSFWDDTVRRCFQKIQTRSKIRCCIGQAGLQCRGLLLYQLSIHLAWLDDIALQLGFAARYWKVKIRKPDRCLTLPEYPSGLIIQTLHSPAVLLLQSQTRFRALSCTVDRMICRHQVSPIWVTTLRPFILLRSHYISSRYRLRRIPSTLIVFFLVTRIYPKASRILGDHSGLFLGVASLVVPCLRAWWVHGLRDVPLNSMNDQTEP